MSLNLPPQKLSFSKAFHLLLLFFIIANLIFLPYPRTAHAAPQIVSIEIQGNSKTEKSIILSAMQTKVGSAYSREALHEDLKSIFALGAFSNIQIDKEEASGGVKIVVRVKEKMLVSRIVIQGAKEVSEEKVRKVIVQKPLQPLNEKKVSESKEKIKELYTKDGMGFALVTTELKPMPGSPNEAELIFKVSENKALKIRKVSFEGNTVFKDSKLKSFMKTKKKGILSFLTGSGKYREEGIERDIAFITYQYLNQGYLKVQVEKPEILPMPDGKGIELRFRIHEGERYKVRNIEISGDILTTKEELIAPFAPMKGHYFSQKNLEEGLVKLTALYGNQGYAFANIQPRPIPVESSQEVDIQINIEKDRKVYIEKINITGNTVTRDKVIRRELKVTENSLYNEELIKYSKQRLEALGFFETVEFSTPKGSSDDKLILNIQVKEKPTGTFSVGAVYSSVEKFGFTASVSKQNFLGYGISASLMADVSKLRQQFALQIYDRYFLDTRWILGANVSKLLIRYDEFDRDSLGGELTFGHQLFDYSSVSLGYRIEHVKVDNFSSIVPEFFKKNPSGLTSGLVFAIDRDTRNNRITATKGSYHQASVEYAGLGGDNHYLRVGGNTRWYFPLPLPKNSVLKLNGRVGYIKSLNDRPVPLFERFFVGGINSLRGYRPRTVGPSVYIPPSPTAGDKEFVYGGDKQMFFNLEYEIPIYDPAGIRAVAFIDTGNAFGENEALNPLKFRSNWGVGLRWISPFGPLRFEWGFPFKRKPGEDSNVFNFTIGSSF